MYVNTHTFLSVFEKYAFFIDMKWKIKIKFCFEKP